jgi:hypothetical protein
MSGTRARYRSPCRPGSDRLFPGPDGPRAAPNRGIGAAWTPNMACCRQTSQPVALRPESAHGCRDQPRTFLDTAGRICNHSDNTAIVGCLASIPMGVRFRARGDRDDAPSSAADKIWLLARADETRARLSSGLCATANPLCRTAPHGIRQSERAAESDRHCGGRIASGRPSFLFWRLFRQLFRRHKKYVERKHGIKHRAL